MTITTTPEIKALLRALVLAHRGSARDAIVADLLADLELIPNTPDGKQRWISSGQRYCPDFQ